MECLSHCFKHTYDPIFDILLSALAAAGDIEHRFPTQILAGGATIEHQFLGEGETEQYQIFTGYTALVDAPHVCFKIRSSIFW